jgi:hypothetical protein
MPARSGVAIVVAAGLLAVACGSGAARRSTAASTGPTRQPPSVALPEVASSPRRAGPSALDNPTGPGLPKPLLDPNQIESGGPPPDGIPAIDHPRFVRAADVNYLGDREAVIAVTVAGEERAYPIRILIWHEIVNDTVGGVPVAVTYCPLCNTAIAYDRRVGADVVDFGTSGELYNSDLVMYDRQTRSLWVQFLGQAVAGVQTGTRLRAYTTQTVSWRDWRQAHPTAWVLSKDTGFRRDYGLNPYPGYDDIRRTPFLFHKPTDGRLPAMTRVVGLRAGNDAVAITFDALHKTPVIATTLAGQPVVVWLEPGTASPLDDDVVNTGRDVGATGVFQPALDGRILHFHTAPGGFRDEETGSLWNIQGHATSGSLNGRALTPVAHVDTFWFAWAVFLPSTRMIAS